MEICFLYNANSAKLVRILLCLSISSISYIIQNSAWKINTYGYKPLLLNPQVLADAAEMGAKRDNEMIWVEVQRHIYVIERIV